MSKRLVFPLAVIVCHASLVDSVLAVDFVRADTTDNGRVDISDAVRGLGTLFQDTAEPTCWKAFDANDDGRVNIVDPVFTLNFLFQAGGVQPPPPFPDCGPDPTPDGLTCVSSHCPVTVIIPETTKVVDEATAGGLASVSPGGTLAFSETSDVLASLAQDDVIVIGVSDATPRGFLGKVRSVSAQGDQVVVETDPARLQDAIQTGRLQASRELGMDDVAETITHVEGVTLQGAVVRKGMEAEQGEGFVLGLNDVVIYEEDGAEVTVSGTLAVHPTFDITIDIDGFALDELTFGFGTDEGLSVRLDAGVDAVVGKEIRLVTIVFAVITIEIGPIPIVLTPQMTICLGAEGKVSAGLTVSVNQDASFMVDLGLRDGEWGVFEESSSDFDFDIPSPEVEVSGRVFGGPRFAILIYGAVGPFVEADAYMELAASVGGSPPCLSWELAAGLEAAVGMAFIADFREEFLDVREVLAEFDCTGGGEPPTSGTFWARSYGGELSERAVSVRETSDGGYILISTALSFLGGGPIAWAVKVDENGDIQWQRAYRGLGLPTSAAQSSDGGYVISGGLLGSSLTDARFSKLDAEGRVLWSRLYEAEGDTRIGPHALQVTTDGSYVLAGQARDGADTDAWIARVDAAGDVIWSRRYGGPDQDGANSIEQTADGGFIVGGVYYGSPAESSDYWAFKLDASGNVVWSKRYGGVDDGLGASDGLDTGYDITATSDGGYVLVGYSISFGVADAWTLKLDGNGNVMWNTNFDGGGFVDRGVAIVEASDGGYVIAGRSGLLSRESSAWVFKLSTGGSVSWSRTYGGPGADTAGNSTGQYLGAGDPIQATRDGGFIVAGTTASFGGGEQAWLLKLTRTGDIEFNPDSGATTDNLTGSFTGPEVYKEVPTPVAPVDLPLMITDETNEVEIEVTNVIPVQQSP